VRIFPSKLVWVLAESLAKNAPRCGPRIGSASDVREVHVCRCKTMVAGSRSTFVQNEKAPKGNFIAHKEELTGPNSSLNLFVLGNDVILDRQGGAGQPRSFVTMTGHENT
jgi:hypothetical protein